MVGRAGRQAVERLEVHGHALRDELFYGPYFCAEQNPRGYELTARVPDGPTVQLMQKVAAKHEMVMVVSVYEEQGDLVIMGWVVRKNDMA